MNGLDPGAIVAKLGIAVVQRTAPTAVDLITSRIRGITLLLIGPSGSGKTAFFEYLNYGLLLPESEHMTTVTPTSSTNPVSLTVGKNKLLKLRVKRSVDSAGQRGPVAHATLIDEKRPHAVLLILDSTAPVAALKNWVSQFCESAESVFRRFPARKRKLRSFIVCLNKADKNTSTQYLSARSRAIRACLVKGLASTLGTYYVKSVPILRCISVQTEPPQNESTLLIDAVIARLATQVRKDGIR